MAPSQTEVTKRALGAHALSASRYGPPFIITSSASTEPPGTHSTSRCGVSAKVACGTSAIGGFESVTKVRVGTAWAVSARTTMVTAHWSATSLAMLLNTSYGPATSSGSTPG